MRFEATLGLGVCLCLKVPALQFSLPKVLSYNVEKSIPSCRQNQEVPEIVPFEQLANSSGRGHLRRTRSTLLNLI